MTTAPFTSSVLSTTEQKEITSASTTTSQSEGTTLFMTTRQIEATQPSTTSSDRTVGTTMATGSDSTSAQQVESTTESKTTTTTTLITRVTTTETDTLEGQPCNDVPRIASSMPLDSCVGTASGSFCPVACSEGYQAKDSEILLCKDGLWRVQGECIPEGASVTEGSAAQILLRMNLAVEDADSSSGLEWAEQNVDSLHRAFAKSIDVHPASLRIDLLAPTYRRRLLAQVMAFNVRLTWLLDTSLEVMNRSNSSDSAMEADAIEELALLTDVDGMSRFGEALREELNETSNLTRVSFAALGSAEVINGYAVPEPFWIVGRWDTTACAAMDNGCGSAMEVAEVICSRGSDLLCSGPAEALAGPKPSSRRPCPCAAEAMPAWVIPVTLGVGFCFCMLLGLCLGRQVFKLLPSAMLRKGQEAYAEQCAVQSINSRTSLDQENEMSFIKRLSTLRPTFTGRSSLSSKGGDEMTATRTKVQWDMDIKNLSPTFAKTYSSHVAPDDLHASRASRASDEEVDLEDPVAWEPSFDQRDSRAVTFEASCEPRHDSRTSCCKPTRSHRSSGTLLNSPLSPIDKTDTERTLKRSTL